MVGRQTDTMLMMVQFTNLYIKAFKHGPIAIICPKSCEHSAWPIRKGVMNYNFYHQRRSVLIHKIQQLENVTCDLACQTAGATAITHSFFVFLQSCIRCGHSIQRMAVTGTLKTSNDNKGAENVLLGSIVLGNDHEHFLVDLYHYNGNLYII